MIFPGSFSLYEALGNRRLQAGSGSPVLQAHFHQGQPYMLNDLIQQKSPWALFLTQRTLFLFLFWQFWGCVSQKEGRGPFWERSWLCGDVRPRWLSIVTEAELQVLTSTLVSVTSITRQAGAAKCAASMVNALGLASRSTGMAAILTGVGRWGNH